MNSHYFVAGVSILIAALVSTAWFSLSRMRQRSRADWESLVKKIVWLDSSKVTAIALSLHEEFEEGRGPSPQRHIDPSTIWDSIGGLQGLEIMKSNSRVLIEMASHLQRLYPEAVQVAEELRLDARELEWHIERLRGAARTGNLQVSIPMYAQQAIAIYFRMSRQLLDLCAVVHSPMLADLQKAL